MCSRVHKGRRCVAGSTKQVVCYRTQRARCEVHGAEWGGGFNGCGVQDAQCRSAGVKNTQCVFEGAVCTV